MSETFCRNDAFDIKTFDSEQLETLAEHYCGLVNCSFKSGIFPECEKSAFDPAMPKKRQRFRYFKFKSALVQYIFFYPK